MSKTDHMRFEDQAEMYRVSRLAYEGLRRGDTGPALACAEFMDAHDCPNAAENWRKKVADLSAGTESK